MKRLFCVIALLGLVAGANAQYVSQGVTLTATPQSIAGSTATNFNAAIDARKQKSLAISLSFAGDAAGTANGVAVFSPSLDGTTNTMDTVKVVQLAVAANGAGQFVCGNTNIAESVGGGYGYWMLRYVTNAAASGNITNVTVKYGIKIGAP